MNGTTTISNAATVESGALGVGTLTFQNLAFGTIAGNTANFSASLASKINVTGTFLINGGANSVTINIAGSPSGALPQTYTLIDYATIGGTGFTGFVLGTQPNRAVASLVNNTVDGRVDYTITAVDFPVWKGAVSGNWALGSQGGAENWVLNSNNATSTTFQVADNVHFDDVAGAPQTVAINGADVAVSSVTFSNNAHNYTFTGTHGISGNAPLVKSGTGTVTFNNTNSFTGGVAISAGTIQAAILANDGANSSLGSGASFALDGGATFEYTGAAPGATNRIITANNAVGAGGGTIRTSQNLTLSGAISGAGTLNKAGAGRVIIASTMTGASTVAEGVLEFGAGANFTGTTVNAAEIDIADGSAVAGTITNNNTLRITRNTAGTITSTIGGTGELTMSGLGSVTLGGAAANTFTGITRVLAGVLIAGKTAGTNAIGGNLLIDGGSFQYSAAGTQNEIPDTANITLNSGSFGDALNAGPLAQQTDVVNNVTVNGGTFGSLRSGTSAPFQVNGTLSVGATGAVLLQRGGGLSANTVSIAAGGVVNFDGGSTTGATAPLVQDSRLLVGAGGLTVTDGNFNFNAGPSGLGATSKGSRLQLNGTFTSSGTTNILRAAASLATVPQARSAIELNSGVRTFDVTGTLNLGTTAAPLSVRDGNPPVDAADTTPVPAPGGIAKNGTGILHLPGNQPYTGTTTINGGTLAIDGTLSTSSVAIRAGGTLTGQGSTVGGVTVETGGSIVAGVSGSGALSFPTLTLGTSAGDISSLSIARNGATPAIINVTGTNGLIANGGANSVTVNFGGPNPGVGQYVLIDYAGNLGGGLTAFKTGTLPNRVQTAVLEDDTVNTTIVLNISAIEVPIWTGKTSPEWSTATLAAPKNWGIVGSASTTDFLNQDNVLFDDSAQTTALEISNGDISPSAVRFNNATKSYTLTGPNVITGPATFTKDGAASVTISGANSFTGSVSLNAGTTIVDTVDNTGIAQPLGTSASLTFNGGTLQYNGFAGNTNRALALQGAGTVKTDTSLTLNGLITGTGRLTKSGTGTLILSAANTNFDGGLTIGGGTVQFAAVDGVGGATQIVTLDGGTLEYTAAATLDWAGAAVTRGIASASGGAIRVTAGAAGNGLVLTRAGSLTGAGLIAKDGIGTLRIVADNVGYTGDWRINQGAIEIQSANSLGNGKAAVETGGILVAQSKAAPNTYIVPNDVTLNGGTLQTRSGNLTTYGGNVHVTAPSFTYQRSFTTITASQDITISGPLSGNQPLTIQGNADNTATALILTNPASTFSGQYIVTPSQGLTAHPAITGNPLGTGSISLDSARLGLLDDGTGNGGTVVYGNPVTIGATGATTFNVNRSTAASLPVGNNNTIQLGALTSAAATLNVTGGNGYTVEFNGISNIGATPTINTTTGSLGFRGDVTSTGPLVKTGAGTLHLNGTGTANVTGGVDVQAGTLNVNSTLTSTLDVNIGGTLSGSGTITNNVTTTATGTIAPGNSAGILSLGSSVSFAAGSSFNVELTHISPGGAVIAGTDYDQLNVGTGVLDGTVNIAGANLNLTTGIGFLSTDLFFILLNDGVDAVTGTFANIPAAGTQFTVGGFQFEISYDADAGTGSLHGGNDIALLVPEPGSAALLLGGLAILAGRRRRNVN